MVLNSVSLITQTSILRYELFVELQIVLYCTDNNALELLMRPSIPTQVNTNQFSGSHPKRLVFVLYASPKEHPAELKVKSPALIYAAPAFLLNDVNGLS